MRRRKRPELLTIDDVRERLRAEIAGAGTQSEWALRTGANRSIVSAFLAGKKTLQPGILRALRLKKIVAFTSF
jgi:hypothetical protein